MIILGGGVVITTRSISHVFFTKHYYGQEMPCNTSIFLLALRTATCKLTTRRCSECVVFSHSDKVIVTQHLTDNFTSSVTPSVITDKTPLPCLRVLYVHITLTLNAVNIQKKHVSRCCGKVRNCQILCFSFAVFSKGGK